MAQPQFLQLSCLSCLHEVSPHAAVPALQCFGEHLPCGELFLDVMYTWVMARCMGATAL